MKKTIVIDLNGKWVLRARFAVTVICILLVVAHWVLR